jgi:hypothetical protein
LVGDRAPTYETLALDKLRPGVSEREETFWLAIDENRGPAVKASENLATWVRGLGVTDNEHLANPGSPDGYDIVRGDLWSMAVDASDPDAGEADFDDPEVLNEVDTLARASQSAGFIPLRPGHVERMVGRTHAFGLPVGPGRRLIRRDDAGHAEAIRQCKDR